MFERIGECFGRAGKCIENKLAHLEYGPNFQSLIVLIPGISLIAQRIQNSHLRSNIEANKYDEQIFYREGRKLQTLGLYHCVGDLVQTIALLALAAINPLFMLPAILPIYGLWTSLPPHLANGLDREGNRFYAVCDEWFCSLNFSCG
jgi:hypothetical protein